MKPRFVISVLIVIIVLLTGSFFSACDKRSESTVKASVEKEKTLEAIEKFEKIGAGSGQINPNISELIDEASNSLPRVVASVNDVKITSKPIKTALQRFKAQAIHQKQAVNIDQIKEIINQILDTEIQREILFQKGKELEIKALDEDIDKIIDMMKSRYKKDEEFLSEFSKRGVTLEKLKDQIGRNIIVSKLIQKEVHDKIEISDQQAIDFYKKNRDYFKNQETVHAAHILIKVGQGMSDEEKKTAKKKINDILKKAREGEDFAELAKQYSEGPSASRGGDLSHFSRGQMVKEFEEAAFSLKVGDISDVVETQFGYHIIKAYDKKEAIGLVPFDQVKKNILSFLERSEAEQKTKDYAEDLKTKADIKRFI